MTRLPELTAASAAPTAADAAPASGQVLGDRYVLGTRLGEGGMGVVYRARDRMLQRTVAVKVFRDGTTEMARTATETQLLAGLNHPSLVTLFDAHVGDAPPQYLVMEYVDGPTLGERLIDGPLPSATVRSIALAIGDALQAVHAAGIVHRDVKPSNVLLRSSTVPGEEFHAKLADFGIAHLVDSARQTTPGLVIGSAAYISPEQVTGAPPAYAADIYALGLVLLESLTGRRAFAQAAAHEAALARLAQDPVIPASVGHEWGALLTDMTARDPAQRPTALDVVAAVSDMDPVDAGGPAIVTAYAAIQPGDSAGAPTVTVPMAAMTTPDPASHPAPPVQKNDGLERIAAPAAPAAAPDDPAPVRRSRQRRTILAFGIAIVVFVVAIAMTVGMLVRGAGEQAVAPPPATPAATTAPTTPTRTSTPTPAPAPAAPVDATTPPTTHTAGAGTGTSTGKQSSNGKGSGNGKGAGKGAGKGKGSGSGKGNG